MPKFRYPTGNGTREDFEARYYNAQGFGNKTSYGYHEGIDLNLKTGGDTDMGDALYAIADWQLKYYHLKSHVDSGFGVHFVYQVDSPFGRRWIHYAHVQNPDFNTEQNPSGAVGYRLAEIDSTGRPRGMMRAHLHMAVYKVDPTILPDGIDTIATSRKRLNDWWEDPITFMNNWYNHSMTSQPTDNISIEEIVKDGYLALCGESPSVDELKWRVKSWTSVEDFLKSVTGDGRYYEMYVKPAISKELKAAEVACTSDKVKLEVEWQTKFNTAKLAYDLGIKNIESKKVEKYEWHELVKLGIFKLVGR